MLKAGTLARRGRSQTADERGTALVLGGSIAGLTAARVCAERFAQVMIVERDVLPRQAEARRGVPQAAHTHALLARGSQELERLFPGFDAELASNGMPQLQMGRECGWLAPLGWVPAFEPCIPARFGTRHGIEALLRQRVRALPNVRFIEGTEVRGLTASEGGGRVTGARVRSQEGGEGTLTADLVIDALGRGSRLPGWLGELGYAPPEETRLDSKVTYVTRRMEGLGPRFPPPWRALICLGAPPQPHRAAAIMPIEGGLHLVTLIGAMGESPPAELPGFLEYARSLRSGWIYEIARHGNAVGEAHTSRSTENRYRHYDKLARFPRRLVAVGDAVCATNPVQGQGMTVATLQAAWLGELLDRPSPLDALADGFRRAQGTRLRPLWDLATAEDLETLRATDPLRAAQEQELVARLTSGYFGALFKVARRDRAVSRQLIEVAQLLRPPGVLLRPAVALPVLGTAAKALLRRLRGLPTGQVSEDPADAGWSVPERPPLSLPGGGPGTEPPPADASG